MTAFNKNKSSKHEYLLMVLGLIPFVVSATLLSLGINELFFIADLKKMIALYSLVIVSFMAGVVWGINLLRPQQEIKQKTWLSYLASNRYFYLSNIVALLIWIIYWLAPDSQTFFVTSLLCFIYLLLVDRELCYSGVIDQAYLRVRIIITAAVSVCLVLIIYNMT